MTTRPSKKHDGKIISIRSTQWKEKGEEFGKVLTGTYHHLDNLTTFGFTTTNSRIENTFGRDEWEVINDKLAVWIKEIYVWQDTEHQITEYRQGYIDALKAIVKHMLMN